MIRPTNATNQKVSWASDTETVATVDSTGKITALAAGKATIWVTTSDGNKTATCSVIVPGDLKISFTFGSYQTLRFSSTSLAATVGSKLTLSPSGSLTTGGGSWKWYINETLVSSTPSLGYTFTNPGFYTISLTGMADGIGYSGSITVLVSR